MSITICWRPLDTNDNHFESGMSSEFAVLEETFGGSVSPTDLKTLRAMAKSSGSKLYDEVADTVERVGAIGFWSVY